MFEIEDFTNVIKFVFNRTEEEFIMLYNEVGCFDETYIKNKMSIARENFGVWWCNLDDSAQYKIIKYIKNFYEVRMIKK